MDISEQVSALFSINFRCKKCDSTSVNIEYEPSFNELGVKVKEVVKVVCTECDNGIIVT